MPKSVLVGSDQLRFKVDQDWEQLPPSLTHRDVAGVAVDSADRVYVFNRSEHPVIVYERDGGYMGTWGEGVFRTPHGITIGPDDTVYCVDSGDHTVRRFTTDGRLLQVMGTAGVASDSGIENSDYRTIKHGAPPFHGPTNIAVAPSGDLFVSDGYGNSRIHRFSPNGVLRMSWGELGSGRGQFHVPHGIAVDSAGRVLVADRENDRVQLFTGDGEYLEEWSDLARPCDFAFDRKGNVYIAELGPAGPFSFTPSFASDYPQSRVSVLDSGGKVVTRWGTREDPCAPGSFWAAHDVSVDSRGDVYVGEVNYTGSLDEFDRPIRAHPTVDALPAGCHTLQKFIRVNLA